MIRCLYADELKAYPLLVQTMFKDRAFQFRDRLNWDVTVDDDGLERDQYDDLNPMYLIWEDQNGRHAGSIRLMPTTGRTMTAEHFVDLTDGVRISSPFIWECTRFCLAPGASPAVAAGLMAMGIEIGLRFGLEQAVGVIYTRVLGLYRRCGHTPDVLGTKGEGREKISVCIWNVTEQARDTLCEHAGIPVALIESWANSSFPTGLLQEERELAIA
ncbi:MAG: acyl-homoserine-lactone synthase [Pseudomonadota bacterium]